MAKRKNAEGLAIIAQLAEKLGVDLEDIHSAVATENRGAKASLYDGSLEVILASSFRSIPSVRIESPRSPGVYIELVDHQSNVAAPAGAVYWITAYMPNSDKNCAGTQLNGDVYGVYVGKEGIILDDASKRRLLEAKQSS